MRLPDAEDAYVAPEKVTAYLLNGDHPDGRSKAAFFRAFGFTIDHPEVLIAALKAHPRSNEVAGEQSTAFGDKHIVRCSIESPDGRNPCILSVWIREPGEERSKLVTAYPG